MAQPDAVPAPVQQPPAPGSQSEPLILPKSDTDELTLPSGLRVGARGMGTAEMDRFADPMLIRSNRSVDVVIKECCTEVLDPGPYPEAVAKVGTIGKTGTGRIEWSKVAKVDREVFFVHLRRLSLGDDFDFDATCNSPSCGKPIPWVVQVSTIKVEPMSEEARTSITAKETMPFVLPFDGRTIQHRVMTGDDELYLANYGGKEPMGEMIARRIVSIEGVHSQDRRRWLKPLSLRDQNAFLAEVQRVEGGPDLEFDVTCQRCGKEVSVNVMIDVPFFSADPPRKKSEG